MKPAPACSTIRPLRDYDSLNRLTGLTDFSGSAFAFSYDALGRRTNLTRPNGVSTSYQYDALSRLLSILHQGSAFSGGTSYAYDAVGNRTSRADTFQPTGTNPTQTVTNYSYDAIYELTQAVLNGTTSETYSYDAVGNRLSSLGVPSYLYNSSNELASIGKNTLTYDANGNTLSKATPSGTTMYTWDFENRLSSVTLPNGSVDRFKYDPFGRRIESDGTGRIFVYDGDNIVEDLDLTGKSVARYTQGPGIDEPLEVSQSAMPNYYETDGLGSIVSLTDASGAIANTYSYDSFGNQTQSTGTVSNRFFFTAREAAAKTGLLYYRARYYDAGVGRFLNEDPVRFRGGIDFYSYAKNNSVNLIDPMGLGQSGAAIGGVVGGILGGILGISGGGGAGTLVAPGVGTIAGGIEGGVEGVAAGATVGAAIGAAIGDQIERLMNKSGGALCRIGQVQCWFSGEFKDPSVDPKFRMCTYSCSDGIARVAVIHILLPCPRDPSRIPGFLK